MKLDPSYYARDETPGLQAQRKAQHDWHREQMAEVEGAVADLRDRGFSVQVTNVAELCPEGRPHGVYHFLRWSAPSGGRGDVSRGFGWHSPKQINIATGTTSKNKKAAAHADPDFWAKFTCTVRVPGKVTTGKWVLSRMPQRGFGVNNSGPKIRGGGHVIKADYNVPATINPETVWWDLSANYEGPKRWLWQTRWQTNDPDDAATSAAISVYGPRNAR